MTTLNGVEKSSVRNYYAVKQTDNGKEYAYAFEKKAERKTWLSRHENAKPVTAWDVYRLMDKHPNEALVANRQNRVLKLGADEEINLEKGQRLVRV